MSWRFRRISADFELHIKKFNNNTGRRQSWLLDYDLQQYSIPSNHTTAKEHHLSTGSLINTKRVMQWTRTNWKQRQGIPPRTKDNESLHSIQNAISAAHHPSPLNHTTAATAICFTSSGHLGLYPLGCCQLLAYDVAVSPLQLDSYRAFDVSIFHFCT